MFLSNFRTKATSRNSLFHLKVIVTKSTSRNSSVHWLHPVTVIRGWIRDKRALKQPSLSCQMQLEKSLLHLVKHSFRLFQRSPHHRFPLKAARSTLIGVRRPQKLLCQGKQTSVSSSQTCRTKGFHPSLFMSVCTCTNKMIG